MRFAIVAAWLLAAGTAQAATAVKVDLGSVADAASMAMKLDKTSAKAGAVEFVVTNLSKTKVHEMLVVAVKAAGEALPYNANTDMVEEDKVKSLGETSDLDPGVKKTLKLDLKPGVYELICNQAGHYHHGMKANFTVTP